MSQIGSCCDIREAVVMSQMASCCDIKGRCRGVTKGSCCDIKGSSCDVTNGELLGHHRGQLLWHHKGDPLLWRKGELLCHRWGGNKEPNFGAFELDRCQNTAVIGPMSSCPASKHETTVRNHGQNKRVHIHFLGLTLSLISTYFGKRKSLERHCPRSWSEDPPGSRKLFGFLIS